MIKFKGAYETSLGSAFCERCGTPMKDWEKMATLNEGGGQTYVFRCKKCKNRIEAFNSKG